MITRHALLIALTSLCLCSLGMLPALTVNAQDIDPSLQPMLLVQDMDDDLDCIDFDFQEDAQEVLEEDPGDPHALDPNQDGIACALLPSRDSTREDGVEIAQEADPEAERAARQAEREARRNANAQEDGDGSDEGVVSVTCANFATQEDAQAAFVIDPEGLASLDPDGNGIACEELLDVVTEVDSAAADEPREERRNRRNQDQANNEQGNETIDQPVQSAGPEDLDCIDFQFQEEAQSILDRDLNDPFNLDPNGDGFACSSLPSATPRIVQVPRTGAGAAASWPMLEFGSMAIFAGMALLAAALMRNSQRREEILEH